MVPIPPPPGVDFLPPSKERMMCLTDAWAVHWPDNTDEPIWLFDSELSAKAFARTIADPTTVTWEPINDPERARALLADRRANHPLSCA